MADGKKDFVIPQKVATTITVTPVVGNIIAIRLNQRITDTQLQTTNKKGPSREISGRL
jgi:hypothetical protein